MALKLPIPFPIFAPLLNPKDPTSTHRRPPTEIRFSRWNNANAEKFNQRRRSQQEIEDEIRFERRFTSASKIAEVSDLPASTSGSFKSIGTPSSPSRPSIPGKKSKYSKNPKPDFSSNSHPAFRRFVKNTKISEVQEEKPVGVEAKVTIREDGVSYLIDGAPFEIKHSYTETPKVRPIKLRETPYSPFGPTTMQRPWTGRAPLPPSKKKLKEFDSFVLPPAGKKGVKPVQHPGPFLAGSGPKYVQSREEILGEPLTAEEIKDLIKGCLKTRRQLNMGRDGLTHNMLENIHAHWKRRRVCKIKCKGVCTVDMDNVCEQLEDKTGGKIVYKRGGVLFLFRGRNYNYRTRPRFPLMLWKPITPVYPRLIQRAPEGLTLEEAAAMRKKGRQLIPICKLGKNGVYSDLVKNVREAFEECDLVRINCQGMNGSDYRKIGAKLKDLVPCVLISFEHEHLLMWRGENWEFSLPNLDLNHKEASECNADGATSFAPEKETLTISIKDASPKDPSMKEFPSGSGDASDGGSTNSTREINQPHSLPDLVSTATNSYETETIVANVWSEVTGSEIVLANQKPGVESAIISESAESTLHSSLVADVDTNHDELQDVSKSSQEYNRKASLSSPCLERISSLWKEAVDGGRAAVLGDAPQDADIVFERAVSFAVSAPPGPVFTHRPRKVLVVKEVKQKEAEVAADMQSKEVLTVVPRKTGSERKSSKVRRAIDIDDKYLGVPPQGSLRIDELAKLLA